MADPPRTAVVLWRWGAHSRGRGQRKDPAQNNQTACRCRYNAHPKTDYKGFRVELKDQKGKLKVLKQEAYKCPASYNASQAASQSSAHGNREDQFEIVCTHLGIGIAKSLHQPDLFTFSLNHARNDDVEQKGRYRKENRWNTGAHGAHAVDFFTYETVGLMVFQSVSAQPAIGVKEAIRRIEDGRLLGVTTDSNERLVEGALHIVGGRECGPAHPYHAEATIVGCLLAGRSSVEKLRRLH